MTGLPIDGDGHVREVLDYLGNELEPSILIGGWATFLRVGGDISRDIDLIIGSQEVRAKVESVVVHLSQTSHLQGTKWRGEVEGVHVDIYIPHQSQLGGKLRLKVEVLAQYIEPLDGGKWSLLTIEAHVLSKLAALFDRPDTEKGAKDAQEIARLLESGVEASTACGILAAATAGPLDDLPGHVQSAFQLLGPRAGLNKKRRRWLRDVSRAWNEAIKIATSPTERARPSLD